MSEEKIVLEEVAVPAEEVKPVTLELITAELKTELLKEEWEKKLQAVESMVVTPGNLKECKEKLDTLRDAIEKGKEIYKNRKAPLLTVAKLWDKGKKDTLDSLDVIWEAKLKEVVTVANQMVADRRRQLQEEERIRDINAAIQRFILDQSQLIAAAKDPDWIVTIEKTLGAEKRRASVYQEFLPVLAERIDALRPLIKAQKERIRQFKELEAELEQIKAQEVSNTLEVDGKMKALEAEIAQARGELMDNAIKQSVPLDVIVPEAYTMDDILEPRRRDWKWKLQGDTEEEQAKSLARLYKKMPNLVDVIPNTKKIKSYMKLLQKDGLFNGRTEFPTDWGITYFQDTQY